MYSGDTRDTRNLLAEEAPSVLVLWWCSPRRASSRVMADNVFSFSLGRVFRAGQGQRQIREIHRGETSTVKPLSLLCGNCFCQRGSFRWGALTLTVLLADAGGSQATCPGFFCLYHKMKNAVFGLTKYFSHFLKLDAEGVTHSVVQCMLRVHNTCHR